MSYDGIGMHDWLRGLPGTEQAVRNAFCLLKENGISASAAMYLHRKNVHTIRETVNWLKDNGVRSLKINRIQEVGEWANSAEDIRLTREETVRAYADYIPQFFADDAPLSLILDGAFSFSKSDNTVQISYIRPCLPEHEADRLSCPSLGKSFYIGAEGMTAPCMMMADNPYSKHFPNLHTTPLKEILGESDLMTLTQVKVADARNGNAECRSCPHLKKCSGGCRQAALSAAGNYFGPDPAVCEFFRSGWDDLIFQAMDRPYKEFLRRNGLSPEQSGQEEPPVC